MVSSLKLLLSATLLGLQTRTSSHVMFLGPSFNYSAAKEQRYIASSSAEAELCQLFVTTKRIHAFVAFLLELKLTIITCTLLTDMLIYIEHLKKPLQQRQKRIAVYFCYLRDLQERF